MKDSEKRDVDARFMLANERTLLAWIRTALTLQAGGFALVHLVNGKTIEFYVGIFVILLGAVVAGIGYIRYRSADMMIRTGKLPDKSLAALATVLLIVFMGIFLAGILVLGLN